MKDRIISMQESHIKQLIVQICAINFNNHEQKEVEDIK